MNDERLERLVREAIPSGPAPEVKAELLRRASRMLAARRRGRIIEWAFAAAAGLLIAINVAFGHIHERRLEAITGRPAITTPVDPAAFAAMVDWRTRELLEIMSEWGNS